MGTAVQLEEKREEKADRLARARRALGAAELSAARWGGRIDRTALRESPTASESTTASESASPPEDGAVRAPMRLLPPPGRPDAPGRTSAPPADDPVEVAPTQAPGRLPVPPALAPLIPSGTLRAGSSVAVTGGASSSLLLALAVAAMGEDSWCAVAGMPDLGLRGLLDAGADPSRLAIVPGTDVEDLPQLPQVLSALVDGVGVVVIGPDLRLSPALWRTLTGRARTRDALVLAASPPDRADLRLEAQGARWHGLGAGSGRLRGRRVRVSSAGRGIAGRREVEVLLPDVRGALATTPAARGAREASVLPTLRRAV